MKVSLSAATSAVSLVTTSKSLPEDVLSPSKRYILKKLETDAEAQLKIISTDENKNDGFCMDLSGSRCI